MSLHTSDDSDCSDFSYDSLNLFSAERGEDCENVISAEISVNANGGISPSEAMETDAQIPWNDATGTFPRQAGSNNMEIDDIPDRSPDASSDEAWTAEYDRTRAQPPNGADDMPQLFDKLTLATGGFAKTARSDDGHNRRKSCNIRVARSWSCLRNISHRKTKTAPPASDSKQISYLELYRRNLYGVRAVMQSSKRRKELEDGQPPAATKGSKEEKMQPREPVSPCNTPTSNACDTGNVNRKSDEPRENNAESKEVDEAHSNQCPPHEKQFIEAACEFTKSLSEQETQNRKPYTRRTVADLKHSRPQVPLKLGSLGFDKEAVKEKYERFRRQQCYGEQASIRNRMRMSQIQKARDKPVEDKQGGSVKNFNSSESDIVHKRSDQVRLGQKFAFDSRQKTTKVSCAKSYSDSVRISAVASRRYSLKSVVLPSRNSMDPIKPLVERHVKENEIVDTIRRSFGRTKLNLKP